MRKLSIDHVFGCSTSHRHSLIGLPNNRFAFIAGCYLVIFDCLTREQRYLTFSPIEFLYISPRGTLMAIIDRITPNLDSKIHLFSTQPIEQLSVMEPDRFGSFQSVTMNNDESVLAVLHGEPGYMLTLQGIHWDMDEEQTWKMTDLASIRLVQGPVLNRMTKEEVTPHAVFISFCPSALDRFCVTGTAIFKLFVIEEQNLHNLLIHFRAEFYSFTCHCWIDTNSILVATDHGHIFWIHEGSIQSDIHLEESLKIDLETFQETSSDLKSLHDSIEHSPVNSLSKIKAESDKPLIYLDLITSNELSPHVIVSFQEYLLVLIPIENEPFFRVISRTRLAEHREQQIDIDIQRIHKMSYLIDGHRSWIYLLTDRNQIFRCDIDHDSSRLQLIEEHLYGSHVTNVTSIGLCAYKPWLITLDNDHSIRIFDYQDFHREIFHKSIPDDPHLISNFDPFGFHLCSATNNRLQINLMANHELRLIHQYETRNIRQLVMSHGGHLVAIVSNNFIKIYSINHFNLVSQLRGHVGKIQQVIWCKNDSMLISCSADGMIYTFNSLTGARENEIITKQFRYIGIAATNDAQRIYAITTDSSIKVFNNTTLDEEFPIENDFLPSAITLSKSERLLYIGMTHGLIRIYPIPLLSEIFIDLAAHCSTIRRLIVSNDDQYLVSMAESAYVLLFRQTNELIQSMSSHYEFARLNVDEIETNLTQKSTGIPKYFDFILITKSEIDDQQKKIDETKAKINEFETENNLKLQGKRLAFAQQLNSYSTKFETLMKGFLETREQMKTNLIKSQCQFENDKEQVENHYVDVENNLETIYERKMIETLSRIESVQFELQKLKNQYEKSSTLTKIDEEKQLTDIVDRFNEILRNKWKSEDEHVENLQTKQREIEETIRQTEIDLDDEIEEEKRFFLEKMKIFTDYFQSLTIDVNSLRKQYNSILNRIETRDHQLSLIEKDVKDFENRRIDLIDQIENFRTIIQKKEDRIGNHDMKLHRLQQQILHIEKRKNVLDYKTKSLMEQIEPIDQEIQRFKTNNGQLEQQLTRLKQKQNQIQQREEISQKKFLQSTKKLVETKKNRQKLEKIVRGYRETIKKAYDSMVISCSSSENRSEKWKNYLEKIFHQLQNEEQTEDQLEIEGFLNEWTRQRRWLLSNLNNLMKIADEQKQQIAQTQREHRKNLAPFINQLRDLHRLQNEIEKKIQKRFLLLKIKPNEQNEFLRQLNEILHGDQKRHLIVENLRQTELFLESQEREIQRVAGRVFQQEFCHFADENDDKSKSER